MSFNFGDVQKPIDMATKAGGYARLPFEGLLQVTLQEFEVVRKEGKTGYVKMILNAAEADTAGVIFTNVMLEGAAAFQFAQFLVSSGAMTQDEVNAAIAAKTSINESEICAKIVAAGKPFAIEIENKPDQKGGVISSQKNFVTAERYAEAVAKGLNRRYTTAPNGVKKNGATSTAAAAALTEVLF